MIEIGLNKYGVIIEKHSLGKNIWKETIGRHIFVVYMSKQLLSKFEGSQADFL